VSARTRIILYLAFCSTGQVTRTQKKSLSNHGQALGSWLGQS
jgi:hypothetical protein